MSLSEIKLTGLAQPAPEPFGLLAEILAAEFNPVYGARPLKRAIQPQLENPLSQAD